MTGPFFPAFLIGAGRDWPALFHVFTIMNAGQAQPIAWRGVMEELEIAGEDGAFIKRVLKIDPDQRPTADTLLQDIWFE